MRCVGGISYALQFQTSLCFSCTFHRHDKSLCLLSMLLVLPKAKTVVLVLFHEVRGNPSPFIQIRGTSKAMLHRSIHSSRWYIICLCFSSITIQAVWCIINIFMLSYCILTVAEGNLLQIQPELEKLVDVQSKTKLLCCCLMEASDVC